MKPEDFVLRLAVLILGGAFSTSTSAQNVSPLPVELGITRDGRLDDSAPRRPSNHAFACYSINTKPGEEVSIQLKSSAFDPVLEVGRGALCNAASLQFENDNASESTQDAHLSFRAVGGRYLIFVRGTSSAAAGAYRMKIAGSADSSAAPQVAESDEAQRRRQIMAVEVEKRNAEIAAAEAKRQAELAAQARLAALQAEQSRYDQDLRASRDEEVFDDYQPPNRNPFEVFTTTLMNEYNANQQRDEAFRRNIEDAVRRGEAEYQRRQAQENQQRQDLAMRQAAARQAQAAQAQRLAEERARAAQEAARRVQLAQGQNVSAPRTSDRVVAYPSGGQTTTSNSSSRTEQASTRNDPATCVAGPDLVKNPNCPNGAGSQVRNQCEHSIDARICHWTTQGRWDCGITSVSPGRTGGYPSCYGTGRMWMQVRYSDSRTRFADPP